MRGSYVAFVYPSHFIPLWVLMTVLYARIYCRSRGPLHDFESTSELRLSRGILPPHPTPRHHFNNNNNNNNNSSSAFATDTGATSRCRRRNSCDDITIIKPRPLVNGVGNGHNSAVQLTSSHNTPDSPHPTLTRGDTSSATVINLASDTDVRAEGQGQRDVLTDAETGRQHAEAAETQQHQRDHVKHQLHHSYQVTRRKENWHAARILALLVGFFVLSWSPLVLW